MSSVKGSVSSIQSPVSSVKFDPSHVSSQKVGARQVGEWFICPENVNPTCLAPTTTTPRIIEMIPSHYQKHSRITHHVSRFTILLALFLFLAITPLAQSQQVSPTEAMLRANQNYEASQFAEAAAIYEAIVEAGVRNSDLYYNLGNAYFKQGDLGRAILNYRRAQRLTPRDADVVTNLSFARAQTVDQLEVAEGGLTNLVLVAEEWFTLNEAAVLALVLWVLICYFTVLAILLPRLRRAFGWVMAILALFLAIGLISIINRFYTEWRYPPAVVVAQEIDVTSGPGSSEQYLIEFTLHAGTEIRLLESRPGWQRIALSGDLQGWTPAEAVGGIIQE